MQISKLATYAIIALHEIDASGGRPVTLARLAEVIGRASGERATRQFVQQLMLGPMEAGIVSSVRGPLGGYLLTRTLDRVSVYDVMAAESRARREGRYGARTYARELAAKINRQIEASLRRIKIGDLRDMGGNR